VAEFTRFGWALMAPGIEADVSAGFLAVDAVSDYEKLCALDVLGLAESPAGDQLEVNKEFRGILKRAGMKRDYRGKEIIHLSQLTRRVVYDAYTLNFPNYAAWELGEYDTIIRDQLTEGMVEPAPLKATGKEFYMPHRAVIRETAETTKMRVVYDCSARGAKEAPLNDCLEPGPALQNKIYDVLVRGRFHSVAFAGDMRQAFLQVRIREGERNAPRLHWLHDKFKSSRLQVRCPGSHPRRFFEFCRDSSQHVF